MSDHDKKHFPPQGDSRDTFEANRFEDETLQRVHSQLMREKEEPTERFSPTPLALIGMFMLLAFWAGIYLIKYSGGFDPFHYDETKQAGAGAAAEAPREIDMLALGRRVYSQNCVACHQANGLGLPNVYPPLNGSDWVKDNPERIIKVVLSGLQGAVVVNGNTYNNAMTPFGRLSDREIAAVLTFLRTDPEFNNNSYEVTPELVAAVRADYGARTDPWTQAELEAIHGPVVGSWQPPAAAAPAESAAAEEAPAVEETPAP